MLKIGHRGASGYEPENTIRSFKKAVELGADMIEFDVHICKSGEVVVIHDEKVNRTTNGRGQVANKTLDELKKLDAGRGEKIPTVEEVFDSIGRRVVLNIELKGEKTAKPIYKIIKNYIKDFDWFYDDFLVSSFDYSKLKEMRGLDHKIRLGLILNKFNKELPKFLKDLDIYSIHISRKERKILNEDYINFLGKLGVKVFTWTANQKGDIKKLKTLGVGGIFSDYPDRI